ncbi:MAG: glycopeptide antibiotics resistance protein [Halobacteriales archaeon]|jgi:glycopeptide antibiotics resistance protein
MVAPAAILLILLRLVLFALALGLTLISFQAYWKNRSKRLESAFIGFAFISMGVALSNISTQVQTQQTLFNIVETIPFIIGFTMLWASLYR